MKKLYFILVLLTLGSCAVLFYQEMSLLDRAQPYKPGLSQDQLDIVDRFNAIDDTAGYTRIGAFVLLLILANVIGIATKKNAGLFFFLTGLVFIGVTLVNLFYVDDAFIAFKKAIGLSETAVSMYLVAGLGLSVAALVIALGDYLLIRRLNLGRRARLERGIRNDDLRPTSTVLDEPNEPPSLR